MRYSRFILFTLLFAAIPACAQTLVTESEPNNTYSTADVIAYSPSVVTGDISVAGDIDYFRMIVFGYQTIHAKLYPAPLTSQFLYIYSQAGRIVAQSTRPGGQVQEIYYMNPSPYGFYFYAVVRSPIGVSSVDPYNLQLSW